MVRKVKKKKTIIKWLLCTALMALIACVEEFQFDSHNYEKLLVVDGNISDQARAHEIKLFYTVPINNADPASAAVTNATVWVEDNLGNQTNFSQQGNGIYTSPDNFAGIAGRSYALFISTPEGKNYQSSFQELVASPEISGIYNQFEVETGDGQATAIPGAQFFIDVETAGQSTGFFRYEWNDTHQIIVPFIKNFDATRQLNGTYTTSTFDLDVRECYRERSFNSLILATSSGNANGQLRDVPIKFSPSSDFDVTTTYSLEVTQRALSAEAYNYYRQIQLLNEANGTLFDRQQGTIVGNMTSDSPGETVLGFFEVSGASSKRVFLGLSELAPGVLEYTFRTCERFAQIEYEGSLSAFYDALDIADPSERESTIVIRASYELFDIYPSTYILAHEDCVDCRYRGKLGKPDYWP